MQVIHNIITLETPFDPGLEDHHFPPTVPPVKPVQKSIKDILSSGRKGSYRDEK